MACKHLVAAALGVVAAASPLSAQHGPQPGPSPDDSADTRYCLRIEAITGSRIETIRCWTRQEWADLGVDLEKEWPREGVRVLR